MPLNSEFLRAALTGYQHRLAQIDTQMAELRRRIAATSRDAAPTAAPARKRRRLSAQGRANIIAATKRRWAAVRRAQAAKVERAPKKTATPKRSSKAGPPKERRATGNTVRRSRTKTRAVAPPFPTPGAPVVKE